MIIREVSVPLMDKEIYRRISYTMALLQAAKYNVFINLIFQRSERNKK